MDIIQEFVVHEESMDKDGLDVVDAGLLGQVYDTCEFTQVGSISLCNRC